MPFFEVTEKYPMARAKACTLVFGSSNMAFFQIVRLGLRAVFFRKKLALLVMAANAAIHGSGPPARYI
jgi:hypothetical protein